MVKNEYVPSDLDKLYDKIYFAEQKKLRLYSKWYGFIFKWYDKIVELIWWGKQFDVDKEVKWFIQRGIRGYCDRDIWGFSSYLADVIVKGLEDLNTHKHGYPIGLTEDEWDIAMNKMISAFRKVKLVADGDACFYRPGMLPSKELRIFNKKDEKEVDEGWYLFKKYFYSLWD